MLVDSGFWSFPRYRLSTNPVTLEPESKYILSFENVPAARMTLKLDLIAKDANQSPKAVVKLLESQGAVLDVGIKSARGISIGEVRKAMGEWELAESSTRIFLWHPNLRDLELSTSQTYILTIELSGVETNLPPLTVRPVLEGGGNEML